MPPAGRALERLILELMDSGQPLLVAAPENPLWRAGGVLLLVLLPAVLGWLASRLAGSGGGGDAWRAHLARGRRLVRESEALVVLDEPSGGGALRMLVFKSAPALRQSEARVHYLDGAAVVQHQPVLASHVNRGMACGVALLDLARTPLLQGAAPAADDAGAVRAAVIGAGGCVLPCWLCGLSPSIAVDAVESCAEVAAAATDCFGAGSVGPALRLVVQDGATFVESAAGSYDLLFVTAGGASDLATGCLAPPTSLCSASFARHARRALRPGGVYAVNVLAPTDAGARQAVATLRERLLATGFPASGVHVACTSFRSSDGGGGAGGNVILFAALGGGRGEGGGDEGGGEPVEWAQLAGRLKGCRNPWLQALEKAESGGSGSSLVAWQTWAQFEQAAERVDRD